MSERIETYWQEFLSTQSIEVRPTAYTAWSFGNTPDMADELGELVRRGIKRATTSLGWIYEKFPEENFPLAGEYSVILNSSREPLCIIRTSEVFARKYSEIDEAYARTEGEGDGSLAHWRRAHWEFFKGACKLVGREPHEDMPVICEIFELVYPTNPSV